MKSVLKIAGESAWLLGPLAVCGSTVLLVAHATNRPLSVAGIGLLASGVTATYALDHWVDLPKNRRTSTLLVLAGIAAVLGIFCVFWLPMWKFALAVTLGIVGLSYRQLKKWPLGKTLLVAGAWTAAGLGFPIEWGAGDLYFTPLAEALFVFFTAGALLCDFKDGATDAHSGVRTAVVLWGPRIAAFAAGALAVGATIIALAAGRHGLAIAGLVLLALAASPKLVSRPVLGPALVDGALALPAVLILTGLAK